MAAPKTAPLANATIHPFLKWAGGKRWLAASHNLLLPTSFNKYYEPFLGSAAIFFSLRPDKAVLADVNKELINCYIALRDDWVTVEELLKAHHISHSHDYYYQMRASNPRSLAKKAARFIYLNRTCWNGLYRVNLNSQFNVPKGTKTNVLLGTDNFQSVSKLLQNVELLNADFEVSLRNAKTGDFIFVDPPYTVKHNFNGFVKYNETMFRWEDQLRLSESLINASKKGCQILITNANHPSIVDLYKHDFELIPLTRSSVIAASSANRGIYEELAIKNF
jgi:DNA adenine methylase